MPRTLASAFKPLMILVGMCLLLSACDRTPTTTVPASGQKARSVAEIILSGELRILTRNAATTYYLDRDNQPAGPEYEMAHAFAASMGVKPTFIIKETVSDILDGIISGEGDIAAAGLSITPERLQRLQFSEPLREAPQQLVCRRQGKVAKNLSQLAGVNLEIIADSSYEMTLKALKETHPELQWTTNGDAGTEQLLQKVWTRKIDCTIADANIVKVNRRYLPELIVMFDVSDNQPQAWALPKDAVELTRLVNQWLSSPAGEDTLAEVDHRYYEFIEHFDYVDTRKLIRRIDDRLPRYLPLFEKAAEKHQIDPLLLAAQAYQESHWNARAKSPTGVRGIMMLTRNTAKSLGVENRLDPQQAIPAGARYLAKLKTRFKEEIPEPDRTYMALAAYNIGRAHMHDAQSLARQLGKDPHSWNELEEVLPLLSDKRYYKKLKYGYARGLEPVRYVRRIRNYQDILETRLGDNTTILARGDN